MVTPEKGRNSSGGTKYRWLTVYELSALTLKAEFSVGSNVLIDMGEMDLSLREHRLCCLESFMVFQIATMGSFSSRFGSKHRQYVFPPSLIR